VTVRAELELELDNRAGVARQPRRSASRRGWPKLAALGVLGAVLLLAVAWLRCGPWRGAEPRPSGAAASDQQSDRAEEPFPTRFAAPDRLVAVGDLHGDLASARMALRIAGVLGENDHWSGGHTVLVQTGDVLDRGDAEREVLDLLDRLADEGKAAGGAVHLLNGNHELMNADGDLRYVSPHGFAEFMDVTGLDLSRREVGVLPFEERPRAAAFRPGGPYARKLSDHAIALVVGDTVFAHGGLLPAHARQGLEALNQESRDWLLGRSDRGRELVTQRDSPVWNRAFGLGTALDCAELQAMLAEVGATRLVVGHSIQDHGISQACDRRVWRIDVGMGSVHGARPEALEISAGDVRVLRAPASLSAAAE
jgi:hypothetical protein